MATPWRGWLPALCVAALLSAAWCLRHPTSLGLGLGQGQGLPGARHVAFGAAAAIAAVGAVAWQFARVTSPGTHHAAARPPDPASILRRFPPRIDGAGARGELHKGANEAVIRLLRAQIGQGRELGAQVFAYRHGKLVVSVVGGCFRPMDGADWRGVDAATIFMSYSVAKGVTAAALLTLADDGKLDWSTPTSQIWPTMAMGRADSRQGGRELTIAEAVSHRVGLPGMPLPSWRFWEAYTRAGWRGLWDEGIAWAEDTPPRWAPGSRARYHHLSWSFIVGGEHDHLHTRIQAAFSHLCRAVLQGSRNGLVACTSPILSTGSPSA